MDVEIEHPHVHHRKSGHHWLDLVVPVAALFVSLVSILIAYHHGQVMKELVHQNERLVQANSLPRLSLGLSISRGAKGVEEVRYSLSNDGVGPADIRSVVMVSDNKVIGDYDALLRDCCGMSGFSKSATLENNMIRPGEDLDFLVVQAAPVHQDGLNRLGQMSVDGRIDISVCYCSVFDECWMVRRSGSERPQHVKNCPIRTASRV